MIHLDLPESEADAALGEALESLLADAPICTCDSDGDRLQFSAKCPVKLHRVNAGREGAGQ